MTSPKIGLAGHEQEVDFHPGVYKQELPVGSPLDIALGVIFALVGLIIILTGAFYFWRKIQARRRIRRFLRYVPSVPPISLYLQYTSI